MVRHTLRDKLVRDVSDFGAELHILQEQRKAVANRLGQDFSHLVETAVAVIGMLPLEALQSLGEHT
jgi:hypothetical protein